MTGYTDPTPASDEAVARREPGQRPWWRHRWTLVSVAVAVVIVVAAVVIVSLTRPVPARPGPDGALQIPAGAGAYRALTNTQIDSLPAATYDAVIPGLLDAAAIDPARITRTATIDDDIALYNANKDAAIGRLPRTDFLGNQTTVVPVKREGAWTMILTPARRALPSATRGRAAAQTAGWVRTSGLHPGRHLTSTVTVSVGQQTVTISRGTQHVSYPVGVGSEDTPTPTGVTGYLQARYFDPAQGQDTYPIQLTSLHSTAADAPYGSTGGLIGAHYAATSTGAVSHGCIRLTPQAVTALNQLPLGTPISITA